MQNHPIPPWFSWYISCWNIKNMPKITKTRTVLPKWVALIVLPTLIESERRSTVNSVSTLGHRSFLAKHGCNERWSPRNLASSSICQKLSKTNCQKKTQSIIWCFKKHPSHPKYGEKVGIDGFLPLQSFTNMTSWVTNGDENISKPAPCRLVNQIVADCSSSTHLRHTYPVGVEYKGQDVEAKKWENMGNPEAFFWNTLQHDHLVGGWAIPLKNDY